MLVLSRRVGERILIGDHVAVTVVKVCRGAVRIGIEAPPEMRVMREELAISIAANGQSFSSLTAPIVNDHEAFAEHESMRFIERR